MNEICKLILKEPNLGIAAQENRIVTPLQLSENTLWRNGVERLCSALKLHTTNQMKSMKTVLKS